MNWIALEKLMRQPAPLVEMQRGGVEHAEEHHGLR
jgi:hypothetical protein